MKYLDWWNQAVRDLDTAEYLFKGKRCKEASLFCQQAVEKGLKTVLLKNKKELIKIHDLVELGKLVNLGERFYNDCERLTGIYIDVRYPDMGSEEYSEDESENDLEIAKEILRTPTKSILVSPINLNILYLPHSYILIVLYALRMSNICLVMTYAV